MTAKQTLLTQEDINGFKTQGALELPEQNSGERILVWLSSSGDLHRLDGPASIIIQDMKVRNELWMRAGSPYRKGGPATVTYHPNGAVAEEIWFHNGIAHRDNGPAILRYHQNGQCEEEIWMHKGKCHRFEGPAIQCFYEDGTLFQEEWMRKDLHARPSGPVLVAYYPCGNVEVEMYVLNAEAEESLNILYRRDGSIERRVWKKSNEIHRENGEPAIIYYDENGRILDGEWLRNGAPDTRTPAHKMVLWKKWFKYLKREVA